MYVYVVVYACSEVDSNNYQQLDVQIKHHSPVCMRQCALYKAVCLTACAAVLRATWQTVGTDLEPVSHSTFSKLSYEFFYLFPKMFRIP